MACPLAAERVWTDKSSYIDAERQYFENLSKVSSAGCTTLVSEIAKARQHIKNSLERMDGIEALASTPGKEVLDRITALEAGNEGYRQTIAKLESAVSTCLKRIDTLEASVKRLSLGDSSAPAPASAPAAKKADDDDDMDLFGSDSDEDDGEAARVREQRLAAYAEKKSKKPVLISKSNVILDVKPWDDETDMKKMEEEVRKITCEGLLWGASKLAPLAYGINKLQISCVVEDEKVSIDWLTEEIEKNEDIVQSVDIAAFNKI